MTVTRWTGVLARPVSQQASLGSYDTYAEAQGIVDYLADQDFEVEKTQIIGTDLRMVEQITGRLTWPRALLAGAAGGAWFGLFVGLLMGFLSTVSFGRAMAWGLSWGLIFGLTYAAITYGLSAGRRDFTSRSATIPSHFEVFVAAEHSDHARTVLAGAPR
ncbi:MAG TPA: general stress protein [Actinocrinis sp.]|nr:general stress protein [Actinocrinis sp.]